MGHVWGPYFKNRIELAPCFTGYSGAFEPFGTIATILIVFLLCSTFIVSVFSFHLVVYSQSLSFGNYYKRRFLMKTFDCLLTQLKSAVLMDFLKIYFYSNLIHFIHSINNQKDSNFIFPLQHNENCIQLKIYHKLFSCFDPQTNKCLHRHHAEKVLEQGQMGKSEQKKL